MRNEQRSREYKWNLGFGGRSGPLKGVWGASPEANTFKATCSLKPAERYSYGRIVFYSIHYKNGCLAAADLFHMFTQSIKFYAFHYHVLKSTDF